MLAILDTNVLVSGVLRLHSIPGEIVRQAIAGAFTLAYDMRMYAEYAEVLRRKELALDQELVSILLDRVRQDGLLVTARALRIALPDPDDEPFLGAAIAAGADYLVTGNAAHYPPSHRCGIKVLRPA